MKLTTAEQATPTTVMQRAAAGTNVRQRKCACGRARGPCGECAECRRKRKLGQPDMAIQAKLTVNRPGDKYEREADRVARQVMRSPQRSVQATELPDREEGNEAPRTGPLIQQNVANQFAPTAAPPIVQNVLRAPGRPLAAATRAFMESRFGHDFSQVRVHTEQRAAESASAINARAYTLGRDVVFAGGQYAPGASAGRELLAHELTHVVQQSSGAAGTTQSAGQIQRQPELPEQPGVVDRILLGEDLRAKPEPGSHRLNFLAITRAFSEVADYFQTEGWKLDAATFNRTISRDARVLLNIASFRGPPRSRTSLDNQVAVLQRVYEVAKTLIREELNDQRGLRQRLDSTFQDALQSLRASVRKIGAPEEALENLDEKMLDSMVLPRLRDSMCRTIEEGFEFCGNVISRPDGNFRLTGPVTSSEVAFCGERITLGPGEQPVAYYHSHPRISTSMFGPADQNLTFSDRDRSEADRRGVIYYVINRQNAVLKYFPKESEATVHGRTVEIEKFRDLNCSP